MTQALADRPTEALTLPKDQIDLIKRTVANGATDTELQLFLYDCSRRGIHPLDKLLHFTKRGGKYTPVTSIDFMRAQAAASGEMAGSDDPIFVDGKDHPEAATVTVYRMTGGQRFAYTATARWAEYCPDNAPMWRRMPCTMLGKCAEALALRKAFPQQLAGLYTTDEMDQADKGERAKPIYVEPPAALVDVAQGVEVPNVAGTPRPTPPEGYAYLEALELQNGWCNVGWQGTPYKTKLPQVIAIVEQAYQNGLPVKVHSKKGQWLDKVEVWKPRVETDDIERTAGQDDEVLF